MRHTIQTNALCRINLATQCIKRLFFYRMFPYFNGRA